MKGKIIFGSILAVLLIALVPATGAIEFQAGEHVSTQTMISYQQLYKMDSKELIAFLKSLARDYPILAEQFLTAVNTIQNTPTCLNQLRAEKIEKHQQPRRGEDNQTLLEKIFWKVYNYRVLRLLISLLLFINFQSKFTLLRTMTWGIRVLRWVKLGILLGYVDPSQHQTQTPDIGFQQDLVNDTLTVTYISASNILWSDIAEIGEGSCNPFPAGNVTVGDIITSCTGILVFEYLPTYEVLGVFEFD